MAGCAFVHWKALTCARFQRLWWGVALAWSERIGINALLTLGDEDKDCGKGLPLE